MNSCRARPRPDSAMMLALLLWRFRHASRRTPWPNRVRFHFPMAANCAWTSIRCRDQKKCRSLAENGNAEIELWCDSARVQLIVAGNTITVIVGTRSSRQCGTVILDIYDQ
jgi:hypothetical protein